MSIIDYYKILQIERTASQTEIKKRYLELARKYHPDKNSNNPEAQSIIRVINEAYSCLGNLDKRLAYHIKLTEQDEIKNSAKIKLQNRKKKKKKDRESRLDDILKQYE
jgi:curved DNA-binding protein CbpA